MKDAPHDRRSLRPFFRRQLGRLREAVVEARSRSRSRSGLEVTRPRRLLVTLTSIEPRLYRLHLVIESLLSQNLRPDGIVLWLDRHLELPTKLERLRAFGLAVKRAEDLGPHTKLVHALGTYPEFTLVTADDDVLYPRDWLRGLHESSIKFPDCIHCYRARRVRLGPSGQLMPLREWDFLTETGALGPELRLFPTGVGGVLYPPGSLHDEIFNREAFRELCPTNDDIWFKAMSLLKGTRARKAEGRFDTRRFHVLSTSKNRELWSVNRDTNDTQARQVFEAYDLMDLLRGAP